MYPQQSTIAQPERTTSNTQPDAPERNDEPLRNDAHQEIAELEAARVSDLQAAIAELNRRLDEAADTEAKHLQLLAMKEKTLQLTHENTDERLSEIRAERDAWKEQAEDWKTQASNQTLLLSQAQENTGRGFWSRLFG